MKDFIIDQEVYDFKNILTRLTKSQIRVFKEMAKGKKLNEISKSLKISKHTVKNQFCYMRERLNLKNSITLYQIAFYYFAVYDE